MCWCLKEWSLYIKFEYTTPPNQQFKVVFSFKDALRPAWSINEKDTEKGKIVGGEGEEGKDRGRRER